MPTGTINIGKSESGAVESVVAGSASHVPTWAKPTNPSTAEKLESSPVNIVAWQLPLTAPLAAWLIRKGNNMGAAGKPLKWFGKALGAPHDFLSSHSGEDATHVASAAVGKIGKWTKSDSLLNAAESMARGESMAVNAIAEHSSTALGAIGGHAEKAVQLIDRSTGGWLGKRRDKHVAKLQQIAKDSLESAEKSHAEAVAEMGSLKSSLPESAQFKDAHDALDAVRTHLSEMPASTEPKLLHERMKLAYENRMKFEKTLKTAKKTAISEGKLGSSWDRLLHRLHIRNNADVAEFDTARKSFGKITKAVASTHEALVEGGSATASAALRGNLKELGAIPGRLLKMSGSTAVNNSLYTVSQGASAIKTEKAFAVRLDTIKNMYASVTHTDPKKVSGLKIILGMTKLPPSMQGAVKDYWRGALPDALTNMGSMVVLHKMMKSGSMGKTMLLAIGVQAGSTAVSAAIAPKNDLLQSYRMIAEAHATGRFEVPKAAYAALIVAARPKLRALDQDDMALLHVADHYAKQHAKASLVLKDMDSGIFDKMYANAQASMSKLAPPTEPAVAAVKAPVAVPAAPATPEAAPISGDHSQPVVGNFSAKVVAESRSSARTAPEPAPSRVEAIQSQGEQPVQVAR